MYQALIFSFTVIVESGNHKPYVGLPSHEAELDHNIFEGRINLTFSKSRDKAFLLFVPDWYDRLPPNNHVTTEEGERFFVFYRHHMLGHILGMLRNESDISFTFDHASLVATVHTREIRT